MNEQSLINLIRTAAFPERADFDGHPTARLKKLRRIRQGKHSVKSLSTSAVLLMACTAALLAQGPPDSCVGTLSASPTSLHYNSQGAPLNTFTVTAAPTCNWFFRYLSGDSFILPQNYGAGTVVFNSTNPILGSPNHLSTI
jgi:hypothetical protein